MFDILFRNAKVIDGTGNPWFYGDVGVEGGTVAAVLPPGSTARARRVADVDGKALCPGFVDGHSHSELLLLDALKNHGFDVAGEVGEPFNPDVHDAVSYEERDDMEPGLVSTLHQRGYRLKDRLLRPAKVSVSRKPA